MYCYVYSMYYTYTLYTNAQYYTITHYTLYYICISNLLQYLFLYMDFQTIWIISSNQQFKFHSAVSANATLQLSNQAHTHALDLLDTRFWHEWTAGMPHLWTKPMIFRFCGPFAHPPSRNTRQHPSTSLAPTNPWDFVDFAEWFPHGRSHPPEVHLFPQLFFHGIFWILALLHPRKPLQSYQSVEKHLFYWNFALKTSEWTMRIIFPGLDLRLKASTQLQSSLAVCFATATWKSTVIHQNVLVGLVIILWVGNIVTNESNKHLKL